MNACMDYWMDRLVGGFVGFGVILSSSVIGRPVTRRIPLLILMHLEVKGQILPIKQPA
jgi:hypothetical protein